jgi:anti-sigma factor RsiW
MNLLLHAYADGELDVMRSLEVEQHVKSCAACAAKLNSLKALRSALKENDLGYRAPNSLRQKIRAAVRVNEPAPSRQLDLQWLWKWLAVGATALAAVAILLRPAGVSEGDAQLDEVVSSHVRSLMADHLTDVLSSDKHTVKPWFAGKLDFSPDVKDFSSQDFPLVGGRLDYINRRTVAALVYRHNKHLINVFIWPVAGNGPEGTAHFHGYNVVSFDTNGFHYSLVSDMEDAELEQLGVLLGNSK